MDIVFLYTHVRFNSKSIPQARPYPRMEGFNRDNAPCAANLELMSGAFRA
jgi:hypothetical protein